MKKSLLLLALIIVLSLATASFTASAEEDTLSAYMAGEYTDEQLRAYVEQLKAESNKTPTRIMFRFQDRYVNQTVEEVRAETTYLTETYIVPLLGESGKVVGQDVNPTHFWICGEGDELFDIYLDLLLLCSGNAEMHAVPVNIDSMLPVENDVPVYDDTDPFNRGDFNDDGKINTLDYAILKSYVMKTSSASSVTFANADLNGDCHINVIDYAILKRFVMGIIPELPAVQPWD
ncbi:MAG: dockerin type I repeat-containing protein [Clostridia bacterium]|nr:dockerin type I repeat-containing protein [Clostridia bacterium]